MLVWPFLLKINELHSYGRGSLRNCLHHLLLHEIFPRHMSALRNGASELLTPLIDAIRGMFSLEPSFMPTTRRCRCLRPAAARRRPVGSGLMCAMTGPQAKVLRRPSASRIRWTARANKWASGRSGILESSASRGR